MALHGRRAVRACIALVVVLVTAQVTWAVPVDQAATPVGEPAGANWSVYGGNLFNQRYSSLDQISPSNVASLKGAWTFTPRAAARRRPSRLHRSSWTARCT